MSDLELLKRFLQNEIDTGGHKIFVFDKDYNAIEFKTTEALNEINNLENQLQQKENIIKEVKEYIKEMPNDEYIGYWKKEIYEILDKVEKENDIEFDVLKALNTDLDDDVKMG